jgi:ABC-2 type transport system ATP-binding protein
MISASGLGKSYGPQTVLDGLDFRIEQGERVALLGLNGAGKTTLFRCLLSLTEFEGELRVDGEAVSKRRKEVRRKIGYVPQKAPPYDMTLAEFVAFFSSIRGASMDGPAATLAELGMPLDQTGDKALGELSGGMVQKALLALLFRAVRDLTEDVTLLFASHRLDEIEILAERVLVLHDTGLAFDGTLEELWRTTDAAPRLWLAVPHAEVERVAAELRECPAVADLRANGAGVEVDVEGTSSLDVLLEVRRRGLPVSEFRTRPPSLELVLHQLSSRRPSRSHVDSPTDEVGR